MNNNKIAGDTNFAIPYKNLLYVLVGLALMVLGYILMAGGGTKDPNVFTGEEMFSFTRTVIAPVLILAGFVVEIFAIMYKPKSKSK
ncbi:MAG: hypothetical protein ACD_77C00392G0019 [uncultured bacterium]|nr:MAG: hypothetical protein ACD_77C00392G0019 [uncultured bacterium]HBY02053.1 DUF3098 domain-containing protein [Rikenellaceae bacterium]